MRHIRAADQALRVISGPSRHHYICRACLAQTTRQIHTSVPRAAELPFLARLRNNIFGSKESDEAKKSLEEAQKKQEEEEDLGVAKTKVIKGKTYEVAAVINSKTRPQKDYVPASTWENLPTIGDEGWLKANADRGEQYTGFLHRKTPELTDEDWSKLLHHVTVEVVLLKLSNRKANKERGFGPGKNGLLTKNVQIVVVEEGVKGQPGSVYLQFDKVETENLILERLTSPGPKSQQQCTPRSQLERVIAKEPVVEYQVDSKGYPSWMNMSLRDPDVKFEIIKRLMLLSGHRISDATITQSSTLADLFDGFRTKEEPKKLCDAVELQELKSSNEFPNVAVYDRRRTPVHKEKDIGRWKIIEEELLARDLPVLGRKHLGKERLSRVS